MDSFVSSVTLTLGLKIDVWIIDDSGTECRRESQTIPSLLL